MVMHSLLYANVIIGNGNIERLNDGVVKNINCQDYTISMGGLLDTSNGGVLREVKKLEINGQWDDNAGQVLVLGAWVNNGIVSVTPTQVGATPSLQFGTQCGSISVRGTSDSDGDGVSDADEGDNAVALGYGITLDQDNDGTYNFLDDDSDNDGLADAVEGGNTIDTDGDGIPDYLDNSDSTPNSVDDSSTTGNTIGDDVSIDILSNDTLEDGSTVVADDFNVTLIAPTGGIVNADGSVTVAGEGTWNYNPATGILIFSPNSGFASSPRPIEYTLTEIATGLSNTAIVSIKYDIEIKAIDDGIIVITYYGAHAIDVLKNDQFSGSVVVAIIQEATYGSLEVVMGNDGMPVVLYTPHPNVNQVPDSFIYSITDKNENVFEATVTLDIQCASTQTSDGDSLGIISMIIMMFMTVMIGLSLVRKEEGHF